MAMIRFNESSLKLSDTYSKFKEKNENPAVKGKKLRDIGRILTKDDIEKAYITIKTSYSNTLSRSAVLAFENQEVLLIHVDNPTDDPELKMVQLIPYLTYSQSDNSYVTYVFMNEQRGRGKSPDDPLPVNASSLHDLLVGGLISNAIKNDGGIKLTTNQNLCRLLMNCYTAFVWQIINREYMIGADRIILDTIHYYINRFFLERIFEAKDDPTTLEGQAIKHFKAIDSMKFQEIKEIYNAANPQSMTELLQLIAGLSPRMADLTFAKFTTKWIDFYKYPSYLAIDNIEYLIFMVATIKRGGELINPLAIKIVKEIRGINHLEEELIKLI